MDLLPYYVEHTNKRLDSIESKVDSLLRFKWQILGGSFALSLAGSFIISIISAYYYLHSK